MELKRVFVRPEFQGQGLGTSLVENLLLWARELGYKTVLLETGKLLKESVHIYQKLGFQVIENYGPYKEIKESLSMRKDIE